MYHLVFEHQTPSHHGIGRTSTLNEEVVQQMAPDAKVYMGGESGNCLVREVFTLIYHERTFVVIEVEDEDQVNNLMTFSNKVFDNSHSWYPVRLSCVLKDVKEERLADSAMLLKLSGKNVVEEDKEVRKKAEGMNTFNRRLKKFMEQVYYAKDHISDEIYDTMQDVASKFEKEITDFRKEKTRAKAQAKKDITSLRAKIMRFAIHKA